MQIHPATALEYASIGSAKGPSKWLLTAAKWLGAAPLVVGVLCLLGWIVIGWFGFANAGFVTIWVGMLFTLFAVAFLIAHYIQTVSRWDPKKGRRWFPQRNQLLVFLLLAANFPIAVGCFWTAVFVDQFYTVSIVNHSTSPVDVTIQSNTEAVEIKRLAPGERKERWMKMSYGKWPWYYTLFRDGETTHGTIFGSIYGVHDVDVVVPQAGSPTATFPAKNRRDHLFGGHSPF